MHDAETKQITIHDLLRRYRERSGDYRDYEAAKREWAATAPTPSEYERGIRAIVEYLGV